MYEPEKGRQRVVGLERKGDGKKDESRRQGVGRKVRGLNEMIPLESGRLES